MLRRFRFTTLLAAGLALLLLTPTASAQNRIGSTVAPSLTLGAGARAQALGHAYAATASGADALFWNPAASARLAPGASGLGSVFVTHHEWLADVSYDALGLTIPVGRSRIVGLSVGRMDYGRQDVTTEDFPDGTGETFGGGELVVGLSYAQALTSEFYIGGTVKTVRQNIWDMNASTVAFDVGFLLDLPRLRNARLAASIQHFGGKMQMEGINSVIFVAKDPANAGGNDNVPANLETGRWDLPLSFRLGLSAVAIQAGNAEVRLLTDIQQTNDNALNSDFGMEARYVLGSVALALRGGYRDLLYADDANVDAHWSYGAGIELDADALRLGVDVAFVPFDRLGNTTLVDARVYF